MAGETHTRAVRSVSAAGAKAALAAAEEAAKVKGLALSIAVVDHSGHLVAFHRADGASVTSIEAALRKARTAAQLGVPSKVFEDLVHGGATSILGFEFVTPSQGGVPLLVDGVVVGGIGGSGGSGEDDEAVASAGAAALGR